MKVVLRDDVDGVGTAGAVVDVSHGYARNYLIPQGLALRAAAGTVAQAADMARARQQRDRRALETAQAVSRVLQAEGVTIAARASARGHLYGSVTSTEVAEAVKAKCRVEIDRRDLSLPQPIRALGSHEVTARLRDEVEFAFNVEVLALET